MDEVNITPNPAGKNLIYARKYRPQQLNDLLGQPAVLSSLTNAVTSGHVPHSFLFTGPRGVGKTSAARILAKSLNCIKGITTNPCQVCDNCREITQSRSIDVLEIDGASHTGVDNIRDLKEKAYNKPVQSRFKLYIVDEVHMLSQSAFNALLKILEEPPEHLIFIFATTEPQKIPETIRSRCQTYQFQRVSREAISTALKKVLANEPDITIHSEEEESIFNLIAEASSGSLRDVLVLLEQISLFSGNKLSLDNIRTFFSSNLPGQPVMLLQYILGRQVQKSIQFLQDFFHQGGNFELLLDVLLKELRFFTLLKGGIKTTEFLQHVQENYPRHILDSAARLPLEFYMYFSSRILKTQEQLKFYQNPLFLLEMLVLKVIYFSEPAADNPSSEKEPPNIIRETSSYNNESSANTYNEAKDRKNNNGRNLTTHILNNCFHASKDKQKDQKEKELTLSPEKISKEEAWEIIRKTMKKCSQIGHNLLAFCELMEINNKQCQIGICPNHQDKAEEIILKFKKVFEMLGLPKIELQYRILETPLDEHCDLPWEVREELPRKYWDSYKTIQNILQGDILSIEQINKKETQDGKNEFQ